MNIAVLGCGRWGTFHAWYANHIGHNVTLWGRPGSARLAALVADRANEYLTLPKEIELSDNLTDALKKAETVIISVGAQGLRALARQLSAEILVGKKFVLCMKGLEIGTGKRLSQVFAEEAGDVPVAVWVGPGHVQDFVREIPNCMVISSVRPELTREIVEIFASPLIRFYYGEDLLGTEIGAAAKNVMGLAAGMLDGMGYGSLKGALMARGARELSRLVEKMGGDPMTIYGLSHLGDYEATLFSPYSNNRRFGEELVSGRKFTKLAEGVYTAEAILHLAANYQVDLPICRTVYEITSQGKDPKSELTRLFLRPTKSE